MRYSLPKIVVLSAAAFVFSGGLAAAQSTPGNAGQDGKTGSAVAVQPASTPSKSALAPSGAATRDITPAAPVDISAYASVVRGSDGAVSTRAASPALAALLSGETTPPAGAATPATKAPKPAKLVPVKSTTVYPYRTVGELDITYGDKVIGCTGTLVGPSTVITAAWCIFGGGGDTLAFADKVVFYPGLVGGNAPNGSYDWDGATVMQGYVTAMTTATSFGDLPYEIGVVTLQQPAGDKLGWLGYQTDVNKSYQPNVITYPAQGWDKMATTTCDVDVASMYRGWAKAVPCGAKPLGSPFFVVDPATKQLYVTALNIWPGQDNESAGWEARMSAVTYQWITDNKK